MLINRRKSSTSWQSDKVSSSKDISEKPFHDFSLNRNGKACSSDLQIEKVCLDSPMVFRSLSLNAASSSKDNSSVESRNFALAPISSIDTFDSGSSKKSDEQTEGKVCLSSSDFNFILQKDIQIDLKYIDNSISDENVMYDIESKPTFSIKEKPPNLSKEMLQSDNDESCLIENPSTFQLISQNKVQKYPPDEVKEFSFKSKMSLNLFSNKKQYNEDTNSANISIKSPLRATKYEVLMKESSELNLDDDKNQVTYTPCEDSRANPSPHDTSSVAHKLSKLIPKVVNRHKIISTKSKKDEIDEKMPKPKITRNNSFHGQSISEDNGKEVKRVNSDVSVTT